MLKKYILSYTNMSTITAAPDDKNENLEPTTAEGSIQVEAPVESLSSLFEDLAQKDFQEPATNPEIDKELKYFDYAQKATSWVSAGLLVLGIFASVVLYVRTLDNPSILSALPFCSSISHFVEGHENTNCLTLNSLSSELERQKTELETSMVQNLAAYIPVKLSAVDMKNSPEVQFIMEKTGDGRRSIVDLLEAFSNVMNDGPGKLPNIECGKITADETGNLDVSCSVYGNDLADTVSKESTSARRYAADFLDRLRQAKTKFALIETPTFLDLAPYSSPDLGIKSTFSTVSQVTVKLRFIPNGKM